MASTNMQARPLKRSTVTSTDGHDSELAPGPAADAGPGPGGQPVTVAPVPVVPLMAVAQGGVGTLKRLPDAVHGHLATFLECSTLDSLASAAWWTWHSEGLCPPHRLLAPVRYVCVDHPSDQHVLERDVSALVRLLERGRRACRSLQINNGYMIKPLGDAIATNVALKEQILGFRVSDQAGARLKISNLLGKLTEMMEKGRLPSLEKLELIFPDDGSLGLGNNDEAEEGGAEGGGEGRKDDPRHVFIRALGASCPRLHTLAIRDMPDRDLPLLAKAMHQRGHEAASMVELGLNRQYEHAEQTMPLEQCQASVTSLLHAPCMSKLKKIWLNMRGRVQGVANCIRSGGASRLTQLYLTKAIYGPDEEGAAELARVMAAGSFPNMVTLELNVLKVPQPALSQLCQAISERRILHSLRSLSLGSVFACTEDASQFFAAVGVGCPCLRRLHLTNDPPEEDGASLCKALGSAFRTRDAPRLTSLEIGEYGCMRNINDLPELAAAVRQHPHGLPSLQIFKLWQEEAPCEESMSAVAAIIARSKSLKELVLEHDDGNGQMEVPVSGVETLALALSPGGMAFEATQRLRKLSVHVRCAADVRALLEALLAGACPTLQSLHTATATHDRMSQRLIDGRSKSPSSHSSSTLTDLSLNDECCIMDAEHTKRLAELLRQPQGLQLEVLCGLECGGHVQSCLELVRSLGSAHTSAKLREISVTFDDEVLEIGQEVVGMIQQGSWPRLKVSDGWMLQNSSDSYKSEAHVLVRAALVQRRAEAKLSAR